VTDRQIDDNAAAATATAAAAGLSVTNSEAANAGIYVYIICIVTDRKIDRRHSCSSSSLSSPRKAASCLRTQVHMLTQKGAGSSVCSYRIHRRLIYKEQRAYVDKPAYVDE